MAGLALIGTFAVGVTAGWIAEQFLRRRANGLFVNMLIGAIGALLGSALYQAMIPSSGAWMSSLIPSFLGASILLFFIAVVRRGGS